ncbi:MAG: hypothetical protein ABI295_00715, partial [Xanthomarina sp.]
MNPIFIGILFVFVLIRFIINKRTFFKGNFNKVSIVFVVYFSMLVLSLSYSEDLGNGVAFITQSFSLLVIP